MSISYSSGFIKRRRFDAVDAVSFDVAAGETLGLVGESGSGKSTTGRAILKLLTPDAGTIRFDGRDITTMGLEYRRAVQAIFQDPAASLNPRQVAGDAVLAPLRRHGLDRPRERAAEAFEQVGLSAGHMSRYPAELSGGQQQRVAIARALALGPRLVVCDEAVSALDLSTQSQIINLLADLRASTGVSFLFIAHDLGIVRHLSDRIAVMLAGRLIEIGPAEALFEHPRHPYTRSLLAATPAAHPSEREEHRVRRAAYRPLHRGAPIRRGEAGCPFRARCGRVMEVCSTETPPVHDVGDGQHVACHLYSEAFSSLNRRRI
ncbi:ABC transporter ATP-binding protein [Actinoplanes sp. NPDC023936]|uniref:ABC transporter ATP-binding protein n=1 Tax=Actinoplanes sp. NPDC023936 TaxID=3154910 RepID=UPI0033CF2FAB